MRIEKYKAFDAKNILRYVGIGKPGRHEHVNSGKSHSSVLNACVAVAGPFRIEVDFTSDSDEKSAWEEAREWEKITICNEGRLHLGTGSLLNRSPGGETVDWCSDRKWFTSPDGISKRFRSSIDVPLGWEPGRNIKGTGKTGGQGFPARKNWVSWFNPNTGQIKQLDKNVLPPAGFIRGTGKKPAGNTKWCFNQLTGKTLRIKGDLPPGFVLGRPKNENKNNR